MSTELDAAKKDNLGQLLLSSARMFDAIAFARASKKYPDARRAHLQLMPHLDEGGTSITDIARRAQVTKQAVGQLVTDMEDGGFVRRRPDPNDGRAKLVTLTRRGRQAMIDGLDIMRALAGELEEDIGSATMQRIIADLGTLCAALKKRS